MRITGDSSRLAILAAAWATVNSKGSMAAPPQYALRDSYPCMCISH